VPWLIENAKADFNGCLRMARDPGEILQKRVAIFPTGRLERSRFAADAFACCWADGGGDLSHWQLEALAFFDHLLYSAANGYANQPRVRYWKDGAEAYGSAADFPIPGCAPERFCLASSGADPAAHRLSAKDDETGANGWAATPLGAIVTAGFDEVVNQLVTYEAVMNEDAEFSGPVTASLTFSSTEIDSPVVARLGRVDTAGIYHALSLGTIRPALRKIDTKRSTATEIAIDTDIPEPLIPNEPA
jgi:uncharacterized protein